MNVVDIATIHIPEGVKLDQSIQVLFYSAPPAEAGGDAPVSFPRLVVLADTGSAVHIRQTFVGHSEISGSSLANNKFVASDKFPSLVWSSTQFAVAAGAAVTHTYIQDLPGSARHVEILSAEMHADSRFVCIYI